MPLLKKAREKRVSSQKEFVFFAAAESRDLVPMCVLPLGHGEPSVGGSEKNGPLTHARVTSDR